MGSNFFIFACVLVGFVSAQFLFEQLSLDEFGRHDFQFRESGKQMMAIQDAHHRDFRKMRERNRQPPHQWGKGRKVIENAVAMGEVSCRFFMDFDGNFPSFKRRSSNNFQVKSVEVFDESTGEQYPVIMKGNDFVAFHENLTHVREKRFVTIRIKHTGCVELDNGCEAETTYSTSFRRSGIADKQSFIEMNVATKVYEEKCSILKRIFNFWPFNRLF
uniref:Uncharacterized protein n=1 Tax=Caenorhabditis tropicalis TaxID=1561998 RepID=A0A1I7USE0_9PELO